MNMKNKKNLKIRDDCKILISYFSFSYLAKKKFHADILHRDINYKWFSLILSSAEFSIFKAWPSFRFPLS